MVKKKKNKQAFWGNEFLHNNLLATRNRFPDLKFTQFTYKEDEFKLSNHFKSPKLSFFIDEITCRKVTKNTIIMPCSKNYLLNVVSTPFSKLSKIVNV